MRARTLIGLFLFVLFAPTPSFAAATTTSQAIDENITVSTTDPLAFSVGVLRFTAALDSIVAPLAAPSAAPENLTETTIVLSPENTKDIWTTSRYAYDGINSSPGGGLDNGELVVGGWGDSYYSLLRFDLAHLPTDVVSVHLELYSIKQRGVGNTAMYLDRVTKSWNWWEQGTGRDKNRLWWADRPTAVQIASLPAPSQNAWYSIDITNVYRQWQDGTAPNYGIQLRPVYAPNTWDEFNSSDYAVNPDLRPRLVITTEHPFCDGGCNSNVLFLPGLEASRLYGPDANGSEKKLWEPNSDASAKEIAMQADGSSVRSDLYTRDVIDHAYLVPVKGDVYKSFLEQLDALKNTDHSIADYVVVPYDWRLSLDDILNNGAQTQDGRLYYSGPLAATSTPFIIQELRWLAKSSRTGKVTIVAHSNGGLLAKALTNKLGAEASQLIDKIIFVAVPQAGTPKAAGAILHGYDQALPIKELSLFGMTEAAARALALNMPSVYNLLPSANYFTYTDDPVITFSADPLLAPWRAAYGDTIHSADQLRTFLTDSSRTALRVADALVSPAIGNAALLAKSEQVHTSLDAWTPPAGIALTEIAGWGEETLSTIAYYQGLASTCTAHIAGICTALTTSPVLQYTPKTVLDGDGTVTVPSALWTPSSTGVGKYWVNLRDYGSSGALGSTINRKHADILEVPELRTFIQNVITASTTSLPKYIVTSTPLNTDSEKQLHFTLHSPLTLNLYDDKGNHTGYSTTTNSLEENIPNSRYLSFGEVQYISVPESSNLNLIMNGYAEGSFTLDMAEVQGVTTLASTTFAAVPSSPSTVASISIPASGGIASASPLAVDENNDGFIDLNLVPKQGSVVIPDLVPPEAVISFSTTTKDFILSGQDNLSSVTITAPYTLTDEAGNTTVLTMKSSEENDRDKEKKEKDEKEKKNARNGDVKFGLAMVVYTTAATPTQILFPENAVEYQWETDKKGAFTKLEQKLEVKKGFNVSASYDNKKNATKIYVKEKDKEEKLKETKSGLIILRLVTNQGKLDFEY